MSREENLLDDLLSVATEELENLTKKENILQETDIFKNENNFPLKNVCITNEPSSSVIHNGDTDSSDDEGNRNYENAKYSECGKNINQLLKDKSPVSCYEKQNSSSWKSKNVFAPPNKASDKLQNRNTEKNKSLVSDVYTDPVFGLRIINPLISSAALKERMVGREAVSFSKISRYLQVYGKEKDWVIAGVIASKSAVKTSQKGSQFCIWTLTDLKDDIKTVSLFLFSSAHKQLWKTMVGTVIGILNPNVLDKKEGSKDEACLSVDNAQKVMIFGQSKDFGTCKSTKKNGDSCTAIVNLNRCDFCIYHIKQEYQKCSKRSELQANFAGRGLTALRNKVLGKNEVFYAGKSYTAIPAKKNRKLEQRDSSRLNSLSGKGKIVNSNKMIKVKDISAPLRKQNASRLEVPQAQRIRDISLLEKLRGSVGIEAKNKLPSTDSTEDNKLKEKHVESTADEKKCEYNVGGTDKTSFQRKLSKTITVGEARATALDTIAKLKSKDEPKQRSNPSKDNANGTATHSDCDIFDMTDMNLDYDDTDFNVSNKNEEPSISHNLANNRNISDTFCRKNVIDVNKLSEPISKDLSSNKNSKSITNDKKNATGTKNLNTGNAYLKSVALQFPVLSGAESNSVIDLNKPINRRHTDKAKLKAIKMIQKTGPLKKADPNSVKGSGRKRPLEETNTSENITKKSKLAESEFISDRFKKMMAATSKHLDLLECRDDEEKEKYFNKMEKKEQMEEKMTNTFKVPCKAVKCLQCKYTSFSASDLCKTERHPLKVFDAMKRFFKCGNCGNRIVSLDIVPTGLCTNCGSGRWEKTGMMKEKVCAIAHSLSIRGGEQQFVNSVVTDSNLNLLVPDD